MIRNHFAAVVGELRDNRCAWIPEAQAWYFHDAGRQLWRPDSGLAERAATEYALKTFPDKLPGRFAREALAYAKTDDTIQRPLADFDAASGLIGTTLGPIKLDSDEPLDPAVPWPVTKTLGGCPNPGWAGSAWAEFLMSAVPDADSRRWLQLWAGSCLKGVSNDRCLLFIYGPGGTGKSLFVEVLMHAFGDYACILPAEILMGRPGADAPYWKATLRGKRLAVINETAEGDYWNSPAAKSLSGGDTIHARNPYGLPFAFQPQFKIVVVSNEPPNLGRVDSAIRDRLVVFPFAQRPTTPDTGLKARLLSEADFVLGWALEGFYALRDQFSDRLTAAAPQMIADATSAYLADVDLVGEWLEEQTETDWQAEYPPHMIYASYVRFVEQMGRRPKSWNNLRNDLVEREAIRCRKSNGKRLVVGLRIPGEWTDA
jgi:putative DNA primase/helicase